MMTDASSTGHTIMLGMVKGPTAQPLGPVTRWRDWRMWDVAKKYVLRTFSLSLLAF
jgi:hypothetical protein